MGLFDHIENEEQRTKAEAAHNAAIQEIKNGIQGQIDEAVAGLKTKNEQLLDEKKKIQNTLKNFENIDPEKAKDALRFLEENEDAQLIKDGKIQELIDKRTSTMKSDHETIVKDLQTQLKDLEISKNNYKTQFERKTIDDSLREAALKAKVRPEAISDILLKGASIFSLAKDNSVEARDAEGKLRKTDDDKVLTPSNWIEGLKATSPHYWPGSAGAGANSGGSGSDGDIDAAIQAAAAKGDMATYRKLRRQKQSA